MGIDIDFLFVEHSGLIYFYFKRKLIVAIILEIVDIFELISKFLKTNKTSKVKYVLF